MKKNREKKTVANSNTNPWKNSKNKKILFSIKHSILYIWRIYMDFCKRIIVTMENKTKYLINEMKLDKIDKYRQNKKWSSMKHEIYANDCGEIWSSNIFFPHDIVERIFSFHVNKFKIHIHVTASIYGMQWSVSVFIYWKCNDAFPSSSYCCCSFHIFYGILLVVKNQNKSKTTTVSEESSHNFCLLFLISKWNQLKWSIVK